MFTDMKLHMHACTYISIPVLRNYVIPLLMTDWFSFGAMIRSPVPNVDVEFRTNNTDPVDRNC